MTTNGPPERFGTRHDPHRQARAAREGPILLHSLSLFREIFAAVYREVPIDTVVEIGVESGAVSAMYAELGASTVYAVDPSPDDAMRRRLAETPAVHLVERASPGALPELPRADLYVVDGDHNHSVVHAELTWILAHTPDAVVVLHDVLWPCSRRDLYYEPSPVPADARVPSSNDGPTVWHDDLTPAGFVGHGAFTAAVRAGGEGNGVLTAVEDALAEADASWDLHVVPAVFGLGIVVRRDAAHARALDEALRPWTGSTLLERMENNRIALYTRVLDLQYGAAAAAGHTAALAETVATQQAAITARDERVAELEATVARERRELRELRAATAPSRSPADRLGLPFLPGALRRLVARRDKR